MKNYFYIIAISFVSCNAGFQLQEGDLLFQDLDSSPLCDAIELVTEGYNGANLSHIGLIISDNGKLKILEAIPPKITLTEIDDFLSRSFDKNGNPKVIVGRLKHKFRKSIPSAINFAKKKINIKYDNLFLTNNKSYYCSELIYDSFKEDHIFKLEPMTFLCPTTEDTLTIWKEYYYNLDTKIPQNQLGINPGNISRSEKIEIIHYYGNPTGMKK